MAVSRFSRRILILIGLGVGVPALLLAVLGVFLTLRIAREVERESVHYNEYLARQVVESFEQELMAHIRSAIGLAETASRADRPLPEILQAIDAGTNEFEGAEFVTVDRLDGYSLLIIDAQPLLYAPGTGRHSGSYFIGTLLRDQKGAFIGAGGWWVDSRKFIIDHLGDVIRERLPSNPRMYGGLEGVRRLSIRIFGPEGTEIGRVRDPDTERTAESEPLTGPLESFTVRVAPTSDTPVVWTSRFVVLEIAFIGLMILVIGAASYFGLRYTLRQLELAQLKSSFVSTVSHELKTPVALIRLAVETLEMGRFSGPEERDKFLHTIGRETVRLSRLVDNILDFARLEAGQKIFRFEDVDVVELVRETLESFRLRLEDQGFAVTVDLPESLPRVRADAQALTHCLLNLLDNAIKYSRQRREVRVSAEARGPFVAVSVKDQGIGIAPADQRRIFEKFVRVEQGLVHDVKGAGLGLSLVDQIMRAHHGRVEVSSVVGEGSTFTLLIPVAGAPALEAGELHRKTG
jgi:signal transduction histidine kinase